MEPTISAINTEKNQEKVGKKVRSKIKGSGMFKNRVVSKMKV